MQTQKIKKVLIANRGEIALRIIRACQELEIKSVCIFSTIDARGVWVRKADECYLIDGDPIQAYLDYERIVALAKEVGADAIHPGYGFLSENPDFAQHCIDNGITFIGPKPEHIAARVTLAVNGDKHHEFAHFCFFLSEAPIFEWSVDNLYRD